VNPAARGLPGGLDGLPARAYQWWQAAFGWLDRRFRPGLAALSARWRRSLQLRVATTTILVTSFIVLLIGQFLVDQIGNGVLKAKRDASITQASLGLEAANAAFDGVAPGDPVNIRDAVDKIIATPTQSTATLGGGALFSKVVRSVDQAVNRQLPVSQPIPDALRRQVDRGTLAVQYAPVRTPGQPGEVPGLIVGQPMTTQAGAFELYYLFPLTAEQRTLGLVQRTVLIAGLALVLLVAMIAALVTRQVVRPVRVAAQTAGRLAGGELSQRIKVSGEDDIALLGESFNDMANSLQQQIQRLENLSRVQQRFTSDVSHELRTPLTTIRMASELLYTRREDFAPELARSVELLSNELDRFESLLADLLEISRYDAGNAHLETEQADLRGIVERAVATARPLADRHGVELSCELPDEPVVAEMDARRIERVLRNLLGNALDHAEGRPVIVRVAADSASVAVTVRDQGVGLRPGEAALVFNRFWRADPSRSRLTGGTGLGLAISLEDVRLHHGWLQAWGARGHGAVFRMTLPRVAGGQLSGSPLPLEPPGVLA